MKRLTSYNEDILMNNFYKCAKTKSNPIDTNEILEYNVSEVR